MKPRSPLASALAVAVLAVVTGCRQEMYNSARYEPHEPSAFFRDRTSDRSIPPGTVPRLLAAAEPRSSDHDYLVRAEAMGVYDNPELYDHYFEGKLNNTLAETFPFPIEKSDLIRGRDRYMIFCSPCHGATGDGKGLIVLRGFSPPPPLYGPLPKVSQAPVGHFFDVMTHGHGAMYSYASRISPDDRWRIAAYIRALQLSQSATKAELEAIPNPTSEEKQLIQEFQ
jgi:mono/diheme cytochrome c family protein